MIIIINKVKIFNLVTTLNFFKFVNITLMFYKKTIVRKTNNPTIIAL